MSSALRAAVPRPGWFEAPRPPDRVRAIFRPGTHRGAYVVVRRGDSLWQIAAGRLPETASCCRGPAPHPPALRPQPLDDRGRPRPHHPRNDAPCSGRQAMNTITAHSCATVQRLPIRTAAPGDRSTASAGRARTARAHSPCRIRSRPPSRPPLDPPRWWWCHTGLPAVGPAPSRGRQRSSRRSSR